MTTRTIEFLDSSGHIALEWEPTDPADVERARADFAMLKLAGCSFFRVVAQQVGEFDPEFARLEVRRVEADEVEPRVEPVEPTVKRGRGRPRGSTNHPKAHRPPEAPPDRVVAARPMRGG